MPPLDRGAKNSGQLRNRVNTCLNKLCDRDTFSIARSDLENMARNLTGEEISSFLICISGIDSSEKSIVRCYCVSLLGVLSAAHGDSLAAHVPRMIAVVIRRLRDPDSAVRSACVNAVTSITASISSTPLSVILSPLVVALFREQDRNAQTGVSLCLSAAVEARRREIDAAEMNKLLSRILKLVKSNGFKAKPSLLLFIGSIVSCGCRIKRGSVRSLISTAIEFLSSDEWAARKGAAVVLIAAAGTESAAEFKTQCISALERRRFDKVKMVRETLNEAVDAWRSVYSSQELMRLIHHEITQVEKHQVNVELKFEEFMGNWAVRKQRLERRLEKLEAAVEKISSSLRTDRTRGASTTDRQTTLTNSK